MMQKKIVIICCLLFISVHWINAQTVYQFLKTGDKYYANADYYTAFYYYNKAREADSAVIESIYKLAEVSRNINDYKSAYLFYEKTLKVDKYKNFPLCEFWMGITAKYQGNYSLAKTCFQRFKDRYSFSDYYKTKAIQEISSTNWAISNSAPVSDITITHLGSEINSAFSEFAASELSDSSYQFSSIRERSSSLDHKNKDFLSRIYTMKLEKNQWVENKDLFKWLDQYQSNIANGSFSEDGMRFYFNICENINVSELRCDIYCSEFRDGTWQAPQRLNDNINLKNYTNTQPYEADNSILFFASDRPNGVGKLDIWSVARKADGSFGEVINLGPVINSPDNEITPFFESKSNRFYFSSDWYDGFGGYDIFYSNMIGNKYQVPINVKQPINSSCNDLYFNTNKDNIRKGYFASNRKGSLFIKGESCCNDIYKFESASNEITKIDTLPPITPLIVETKIDKKTSQIPSKDSIYSTPISKLKNLLPVTVYFHNDIPEPRSTADSTALNYQSTYESYTNMREEYIRAYSVVDQANASKKINNLFDTKVDEGYRNLLLFMTLLKSALTSGLKVQLDIEGYCSPLALNDYNIHLAKRRIASLKNYISNFENGFYRKYLVSQQLVLINSPFGEERAQGGISDDRLDTKNSVYNPNAAVERRVAIIGLTVLP